MTARDTNHPHAERILALDTAIAEHQARVLELHAEREALLLDQAGMKRTTMWCDVHDKYGRRKRQLDVVHVSPSGHWIKRDRDLAVVVTMPRSYVESHPGENYMVAVRSTEPGVHSELTYFASLPKAKAHAIKSVMAAQA